jgi:hypothetical protein
MTTSWKVRAVQARQQVNPHPIKIQAGDLVEIAGQEEDGWIPCRHPSGNESWTPLSYLSSAGEGSTRTALVEYDATDLPMELGEVFLMEREEHGWLWGQTSQGRWGWVPVALVERLDPI